MKRQGRPYLSVEGVEKLTAHAKHIGSCFLFIWKNKGVIGFQRLGQRENATWVGMIGCCTGPNVRHSWPGLTFIRVGYSLCFFSQIISLLGCIIIFYKMYWKCKKKKKSHYRNCNQSDYYSPPPLSLRTSPIIFHIYKDTQNIIILVDYISFVYRLIPPA